MFKKRCAAVAGFLAVLVCSGMVASAYELPSENHNTVADGHAAGKTTAAESVDLNLGGKSIILLEEKTGRVLYERDADLQMPPASITKIMTLLLTMEAMESGRFSLTTLVTCSEHAASMGGAQIWLEAGEQMSVDDLLKAVCIKSANDAAVALAELVDGSEEAFVAHMNRRAKQLGMTGTVFQNASGLDAEGHVSTARDIAAMSRALMRHDKIFEYTRIWMDSLRNGRTELVNTNRLIRFYPGATGLKTGTTDGAGSCLSATAVRNGLSLIGVVMGFENSKTRNAAAKKLLDFGFANWRLLTPEPCPDIPKTIRISRGTVPETEISVGDIPPILLEKNREGSLTQSLTLQTELQAPVQQGQELGRVEIFVDGQPQGAYLLTAARSVPKISYIYMLLQLLKTVF